VSNWRICGGTRRFWHLRTGIHAPLLHRPVGLSTRPTRTRWPAILSGHPTVVAVACGLIGLVASADRSSVGWPFAAAAPGSGRLPHRALEGPVEGEPRAGNTVSENLNPVPHSYENSATQLPGYSTPFSATPTGSTWPLSSWWAHRSFRCSTVGPTRWSPNSPASRRGRPEEHTCSFWRLKPVSTPSSTCRQPPPDENSMPRETWPPCLTGGSQSPHPPTQDRYPGFRVYPKRFMIITFGASILPSAPG
jgi:hypothetical protein